VGAWPLALTALMTIPVRATTTHRLPASGVRRTWRTQRIRVWVSAIADPTPLLRRWCAATTPDRRRVAVGRAIRRADPEAMKAGLMDHPDPAAKAPPPHNVCRSREPLKAPIQGRRASFPDAVQPTG